MSIINEVCFSGIGLDDFSPVVGSNREIMVEARAGAGGYAAFLEQHLLKLEISNKSRRSKGN